MKVRLRALLLPLFLFFAVSAQADEGAHPAEEFKAGETILHHVLDTHDWHFLDLPAGTDAEGRRLYKPIALHLPWILYSSQHGFEFFGSTASLLKSGRYVVSHDHPYLIHPDSSYNLEAFGTHPHGEAYHQHVEAIKGEKVWDFSMTKTVVQIFLVLLFTFWIFTRVAKGYKNNEGKAPSGVQSFMEPIILFVREDVARPYLKDKTEPFLPYLLSLFFFIWFSNLLGITPLNANIMGNISITFTLALLTFILVQINGSKDYWTHIFAMPGVPKVVWLLTTPIEAFGVFTKGVALMIRLFANIAAGHFMILALISLIFIMGKGGDSIGGALGIMPLSVLFTVGIFFLELVVGAVQAYVFVLLSAVFIGQALESHDEHH